MSKPSIKFYTIEALSKNDKEIRKAAKVLCSKYNIPAHQSNDFVNDGYMKAKSSYFDNGKHCTIGGMVTIIRCLILDFHKLHHTKNTFRPDRLPEDFKRTLRDSTTEEEFQNLDFIYTNPTDFDYEEISDDNYRDQLRYIQKLLPPDAFKIIYYTTLLPIELVSEKLDIPEKELKSAKNKIIKYLRQYIKMDDNR